MAMLSEKSKPIIKLGLIINPIAGMGGRVGLKGTDNMVDEAIKRGAIPRAQERARIAFREIIDLSSGIVIYTAKGSMGQELAESMGFETKCLKAPQTTHTTSDDTVALAKAMTETGVDLICFVGGDGTARDLYRSIGTETPVLGIPAGVKIQSPVYAASPQKAGELLRKTLRKSVQHYTLEEVLDLDETLYRRGQVNTHLYGYLKIPYDILLLQGKKCGSALSEAGNQRAIAKGIVQSMTEAVYVIGPGTTTRAVLDELGLDGTLLGVDVVQNGRLVVKDATEAMLLEVIASKNAKLILTPIGGQGYLFGRGNQQVSPAVIEKIGIENTIVIATTQKLQSLRGKPFLVDTGDDALDRSLEGYVRVTTGYQEEIVYKVIR